MSLDHSPRPVFGQPGWRRRMENRYGWDKEFLAVGIILAMLFVSAVLIRADDGGRLSDSKKMGQQPAPGTAAPTFLPLPAWASAKTPPLPDEL